MIKEEIEEIKDEIKTVKQHSETWELIKYQGEQNAKDKLRQNITIWVLILALFFSNMAWIWYINQ